MRTERRRKMRIALAARAVAVALVACAMVSGGPTGAPEAAAGELGYYAPPDYTALDALLGRYVTDSGVRWAAWHASAADRAALRAFIEGMTTTWASGLAPDERLVYWINLYNAVTLDLVLGGYPVDSIKDLGGFLSSPWKRPLVKVEGHDFTLNEIENDVIRKRFDEPRIHFALNCAAASCPPLRAEAYTAARLDEQLAAQTRAFLADPARTRWDPGTGKLVLSKIFDWYRDDFEADGRTLADWVAPYVPGLAEALAAGVRPKVEFADYDWALNEANE